MDQPLAEAWPAARSWDAAAEARYSAFVAAIGQAAAAGRCRTLAACLREPALNPLFEAGAASLRFHADCADVPYVLRAYFAYHEGLPFACAERMVGHGRDARYLRDARPAGLRPWRAAATPRQLLLALGNLVHSGYFRTAPDIEAADCYQVTVRRDTIRPGTMFYDPNGHVVVVYQVDLDGAVRFFDGHPDGYLTHGVLSEKNVLGGARQGGGFKNFRPIYLRDGALVQARNEELSDFGGSEHFARPLAAGKQVKFIDWVRQRLAVSGNAM